MKILGIDTSERNASAAILDTDIGVIGSVSVDLRAGGISHSEGLMSCMDFLLNAAGTHLRDIGLYALTIGPGSFTGLRIGLGTVKGFALATGAPVCALSSLECLAWNFPFSSHPVCALMEARKGEVYAAVFKWKGEGKGEGKGFVAASAGIKTPGVYAVDRLPEFFIEGIGGIEGAIIFAGGGAVAHKKMLADALGDRAVFAPTEMNRISPAVVARLALKRHMDGFCDDPAGLAPVYIKRPQAEETHRGTPAC
jgi:tRNA threonylcarbamoyladenosine biosynthesis protein TsaB